MSSSSDLAAGTDATKAATDSQACVVEVFSDGLGKLCERATSLCQQPDAPAEICRQIATACASAAD